MTSAGHHPSDSRQFIACAQVDPTGPLANLKKLLFSTDNAIVQWLSVYWFVPAACVACTLTLVLVRHCILLCQICRNESFIANQRKTYSELQ